MIKKYLKDWVGISAGRSICGKPASRHEMIAVWILRQTGSLDCSNFSLPRESVENGMLWLRWK